MSAEESQSQESNEDKKSKKKKSKNKNKKNPKKKKKRRVSSEEDNSNEEENENEDEEEDSSGNSDSKKFKKKSKNSNIKFIDIKEESIKKTKDEYIAQIEQLENELQLEQKISLSLDNKNEVNDEFVNLQKNLEEKSNKLEQLIKTNKRQEDALCNLKKQIPTDDDIRLRSKKALNKEMRLITSNSYKNSLNRNNNLFFINQRKSLDESKLEAINIVIKIKEKAINNAIIKMNILKKENESLKKELYKNDDYENNIGLEDNSNENKKRLEQLKDEIKILTNQLEKHKKCLNERNSLEKENTQLKKYLHEIKNNIKKVKSEISQKEKDNEVNTNTLPLETNEDNSTNNNNLSQRNNNNNNQKEKPNTKLKLQTHHPIPILNFTKSIEGVKLPLITSPSKSNYSKIEKNILTDDFYNKLKKFYQGNDGEYEILEKKIKEIENSRSYIENKHKSEIKQFDSKILMLDKQFKVLNNEGKENGANIRVLKYKLNIIKNETKNIFNKIQQLKTKIDFITNVSKEKDFEIFGLKSEIDKVKKKCENKVEPDNSDEEEEESNEKSEFESDSVLDSKNIKKKKVPILDLKDIGNSKKKKKKH